MLEYQAVATRLPVKDLQRARVWYSEKLGLEPAEERQGGLLYTIGPAHAPGTGGGAFALYESGGQADGAFTQMAFDVADLRATMAELRTRGVVFEAYDDGPFRTRDGIVTVAGNYPSKGKGEYGAWFRDCEGNMLGLGQAF